MFHQPNVSDLPRVRPAVFRCDGPIGRSDGVGRREYRMGWLGVAELFRQFTRIDGVIYSDRYLYVCFWIVFLLFIDSI